MNDFDELLSSVGLNINNNYTIDTNIEYVIDDHTTNVPVAQPAREDRADASSTTITMPPPPQPENTTLTDADMLDILTAAGYGNTQEAEATEVSGNALEHIDVGVDTYASSDDYDEDENAESEVDTTSYVDTVIGETLAVTPHEVVSGSEDSVTISVEGREHVIPIHTAPTVELEETPSEPTTTILPENSPTLTINDAVSRFSGAEWFDEVHSQRIILAGLGGIGSWTAFLLARLVPANLTMYDDDRVEVSNMSGQMYGYNNIGEYKSAAMSSIIQNNTSITSLYSRTTRFAEYCDPGPIMICGFDNMDARKTYFEVWSRYVNSIAGTYRKECLYIDGRLSIDTLQVFCIRGDDEYNMKRYKEEFLFDSSEADGTICSLKQTSYLASMIGSIITNLFVNFTANLTEPVIPYDMPFFTEYDARNVIFKTEN
jgi:hypothetical protein